MPPAFQNLPACFSAIDREVVAIEPQLRSYRQHLHAHPELSNHEQQTSQWIAEQLTVAGWSPRVLRNGIGVLCDIELGEPDLDSPLVALRADIDALPIQDSKSAAYRSQVAGVCHACGHDAHTTIVLGAALVAGRLRGGRGASLLSNSLNGGLRLRCLFQPAEEISEGARSLVEQGALEGVRTILGMHVDPDRAVGTVGVRYGALTANCDEVAISVTGRGGHSARPHLTNDPLAAAVQLLSAMYQLVPRASDSRSAAVLSICQIAAGNACNVIPEEVRMLGTLRTIDHEVRRTLQRRMHEIAAGIGTATGTRIVVEFLVPLDAVINSPIATKALHEAARDLLGDASIQVLELPSLGAEDFGAFLTQVPGAMLRLGCAPMEMPHGQTAPGLHSPIFDIDERTLAIGVRLMLRAACLV